MRFLLNLFQLGTNEGSASEVWQVKVRSDLHLARKAYHFFGVLIIIGLYQILTRHQAVIAITVAASLLVTLDFLRLRNRSLNRVTYQLFAPFLRKEEFNKFSGMAYLLSGAFFVVVFFPKPVGLLAFLFLAIGDPISSIVGVLYGKDKIVGNKSLQGSMAGFLACTFTAALYFQFLGIMTDRIILVSLIGGFIGALSELIPVGKLDDNFTIPVISASLLWLMFLFFGGFA